MSRFETSFLVDAPIKAVAAFHARPDVLPKLTPPPILLRVHESGAVAEGMVARFTMWFGPLPIRWKALHVDVRESGFTDVQVEGPLETWRHTHRFVEVTPSITRVEEHIEYSHAKGPRGWLSRALFSRPGLHALFAYRAFVTRREVARSIAQPPREQPSPARAARLN